MYGIINIAKDGTELFVTHHKLENGKWRSKKVEDDRRFLTISSAQAFIKRMQYPSTFKIVEL